MVAQDASGRPLWRCSGTLLSATVYLTAGHCTEAPAAHVEIWFQEDVESGIPGNGYPFTGNVGGTPHTHHNIRVRLLARSKLNQINTGFTGDFSMLLSNNAHTGGTCFGDSGGPNFVGDTAVIAGVTSFGINGDCAGTGGVYRIDGV
ncbi:MAG: trypsin-like serine protease [Acidimicrobiia bacterium]|nr:trypsin-like serine protease [Acidimicrobiia bacterium]